MLKHGKLVMVIAAACGGLLSACGGPSAEDSLAAAKAHLAKNDPRAATIELKNTLQAKPDSAEARFLLGRTLLDIEDRAGAVVELQKALDMGYPVDDVAPVLARALVESGAARKAIELSNVTVLTDPHAVAEFKTQIALARFSEGERGPGNSALSEALAAQPDHAPALLLRARALAEQQDLDGALKIVDEVLARGEDAGARVLRGQVLAAKGEAEAAIEQYRKAISTDPADRAAHTALLAQLFARNDIDGAAKQVDELKRLRPNHPETLYYQARLAAQKGDLKAADELVQQLLKGLPDAPPVLHLAGVVALQRGDLLRAEAHLGKLVGLTPKVAAVRVLLAEVHLRQGDADKALAALQPALDAEKPEPRALSMAGTAHMLLGDAKKAEELLARAARLAPDDTEMRTKLALARLRSGQAGAVGELESIARSDEGTTADMALITMKASRREYDAALKAVDQLAAKMPGKPLPSVLRARIELLRGDPAAARSGFESALKAESAYFPAVEGLVVLDLREGKFDAAESRLQALLQSQPGHARAALRLADVMARAGKPKDAIGAVLTKAVAASPADFALRDQLVRFHLQHKDTQAALSAAQAAAGAFPNANEAAMLLGRAQLAAGDTNQAIASYSKVLSDAPKSLPALLGLAEAQIAAKSYAAAEQTMAKAVEVSPNSEVVQRLAVQADVVGGNLDDALARARALQANAPKSPFGHVLEGDIHAHQKNWSQAVAAYQASLKRAPTPAAAQRLQVVLRGTGDTAQADALAAEWMKAHPDDAMMPFYLASVAIQTEAYPVAETRLRDVLRIAPRHAGAANNLAWVLAKLKKPGALEMAERAQALAPNQPWVLDTLAFVLAEEGQLPRAIEVQKNAVSMAPGAYLYRLQLARFYIEAGDKGAARKELDILSGAGDKFPRQDDVKKLQARL